MGRLIDADKLIEYLLTPSWNVGWDDEIEIINNQPTVEAIPKDQYEARLKADLEAVLEDLDLRLEEMENPYSTRVSGCSKDGWEHGVKNSRFLIQQKINSLKETKDGLHIR